jgi:hypothetical protein
MRNLQFYCGRQPVIPDQVRAKASGEITQIVEGLGQQIDGMDDLLFCHIHMIKIQCIELQFCQRDKLPDIVVDIPGDVLEGLFLYFQLGFKQFLFSIRLDVLQLDRKIHLFFAVRKEDDQDEAQQQ